MLIANNESYNVDVKSAIRNILKDSSDINYVAKTSVNLGWESSERCDDNGGLFGIPVF